MKIGMVAGEASGDLLGASLIQALSQRYPDAVIEGVGGPRMMRAGLRNLFDMERLSVMGIVEPLRRLPDLFRLRRDLYRYFTTHRPDIFIGIDAPDFNIGLEQQLREAHIPTVHYVSPSVWAWRGYRIHRIAKAVNLMLTLFPFEEKYYQANNIPVCCVGHPLAEQIPLHPDTLAARHALGLDAHRTYIALLPGSRNQEVKQLAVPLLLAAKQMSAAKPGLHFLTAALNEAHHAALQAAHQAVAPELPLHFFVGRGHEVMAAADVLVVKSGTSTLEGMLFKKPMVIVYRMSLLTYWLGRCLVRTPYIGLPNLLAGELLVPELIQSAVTPEAMTRQVLYYLDHPEVVAALRTRFESLHYALRRDSANQAVEAMTALFKARGKGLSFTISQQ